MLLFTIQFPPDILQLVLLADQLQLEPFAPPVTTSLCESQFGSTICCTWLGDVGVELTSESMGEVRVQLPHGAATIPPKRTPKLKFVEEVQIDPRGLDNSGFW